MPFTPFHLGPGALFKAIGGERFSFAIFAGAQIAMDIEPLVRLIRRDAVVHGLSHTVVGALAVAAATVAIGRPALNRMFAAAGIGRHVGTGAATISALIGTYSHVALDAVMHGDMRPLWPISDGNPLYHAVPVGMLHLLCVVAGAIGAVAIGARAMRSARG